MLVNLVRRISTATTTEEQTKEQAIANQVGRAPARPVRCYDCDELGHYTVMYARIHDGEENPSNTVTNDGIRPPS